MSRKKSPHRQVLYTRVADEVHSRIIRLSEESGMSISAVAEYLLRKSLGLPVIDTIRDAIERLGNGGDSSTGSAIAHDGIRISGRDNGSGVTLPMGDQMAS